MKSTVTLTGGPFDGAKVDVDKGCALVCEGKPLADGLAASYRPTRDAGVYRFHGTTKVIARLPLPGGVS